MAEKERTTISEANRNLAIRVVVALLALPPILAGMFLGGLWWAVTVGAVVAFTIGEYSMIFARDWRTRILWTVVAVAFPLCVTFYPALAPWSPGLAVMAILLDRLSRDEPIETSAPAVAYGAFGFLYCAVLMTAFIPLREHGWPWIFLALGVTFLNDTFAYFAGRFLGRRKLYERVSPKKTWEGWLGGLAGSIGWAFLMRALLIPELTALDAAALGGLAAIFGPLGDLAESMLKRSIGLKDSGAFFPGHGGWLDRVDAVVFVAPVVMLYAMFRFQ